MMRPVDPRLLRRSRAVRAHLAASVLLGTLTAALIVTQAWLVAWIVADGWARAGLTGALGTAVGGVALVFAGRAMLSWAHEVAATRAAVTVKSALRREVMADLLAEDRPLRPVESGRVIALLGAGLDALDGYFARYLPQLVLALTVPVVVGAAVLWTDVLSAVTIAVTLPLTVVFMVLVGWMTKERTMRRWRARGRLTHHFVDVLDGLLVLKVFGRSRGQVTGLREVGARNRRETMKALRLAFVSSFVLELVATISVALVAVSVGLRVLDGGMDLRTGLFVLMLTPEAYLPLRQVGTHFHDSAEGLAAADDAFALLDDPARHHGRTPPPDLRHTVIGFDDVEVVHAGRTEPALPRSSWAVAPGEIVALTGPSGCGKSTAMSVLLGLVQPTSGTVTLGALALDDVDIVALRRQIAWVPQSPGLLNATIAANVRLGAADLVGSATAGIDPAGVDPARIDMVREALRDSGAQDLEPDRVVEDSGRNLSAGERRRVALARALLRVRVGGTHLMLLDEPTAGLDADAEGVVLSSLRAAGVTVVVIAHRPALIALVDRVVDLEPRVAPPAVAQAQAQAVTW